MATEKEKSEMISTFLAQVGQRHHLTRKIFWKEAITQKEITVFISDEFDLLPGCRWRA